MSEINTEIKETFDKKRVYFYECDYKNRLKISEILKISAEIAGYDYTEKGLSHEFLWDNGMVFLVSRVSFHIKEYPKNQDKLINSTWEKGKKGALFLRGFEIRGEDGKLYIEGTAGWILVNPKTRHIIKPKDFPYKMPQILDRKSEALEVGKITCNNLELIGSKKVKLSDLDGNGHMYNSHYADIAVDELFQHEYDKDVENFRINYVSEAVLGDTISLYKSIEGNRIVIIGKIKEKVCFEAEFIYKIKNNIDKTLEK